MLSELNPQQRVVALHGDGPMLVLAGAGSGKTRAIVHRIAHMILEGGVDPQDILAVTFTNKAAGEMVERIDHLLDGRADRPRWASTFHSFCARILRREAPRLGLPRSFTIFDEDDRKRMLTEVAKSLQMPTDRAALLEYRRFVERARNQAWSPSQAHEQGHGERHDELANLFEHYHLRMRKIGALDFGDLIYAVIELLETDTEAGAFYAHRFKHVLVDEFQDTNPAQYKLLTLLVRPPNNLVVVGDDDQAIYGWRGATVRNLLNFERLFPGAKVVRLEQNYRSTQAILALANAVISENTNRHTKALWTDKPEGKKPRLFLGRSERDEAAFVAHEIGRLRRSGESTLSDVAVFYRTNAQSRAIEEELRRANLPYLVMGGTAFYERAEIRDILAYLRIATNSRDIVAAKRAANTPRRGLGDKTLERLSALAEALDIPILDAFTSSLDEEAGGLRTKGRARAAIPVFLKIVHHLAEMAASEPPSEITLWLTHELDYEAYLRATYPENADDRYANVVELMTAMQSFEDDSRREGTEPTLLRFLEKTALVQPTDTEVTDAHVRLMTIHTAKGLEFPVVFVTGLEEGLLPLLRGNSSEADIEEERRLCYVAVTRAKHTLFLSHVLHRRTYGNVKTQDPSRFLDGIPPSLMARAEQSQSRPGTTQRRQGVGRTWHDDQDQRPQKHHYDLRDTEIPPDGLRFTKPINQRDQVDSGLVGRPVHHNLFGTGQIMAAEETPRGMKLTVKFPRHGTKKVLQRFVTVEGI